MQCAVCSMQYAVCSMQYAVCSMQCAAFKRHYPVFSMQDGLLSSHSQYMASLKRCGEGLGRAWYQKVWRELGTWSPSDCYRNHLLSCNVLSRSRRGRRSRRRPALCPAPAHASCFLLFYNLLLLLDISCFLKTHLARRSRGSKVDSVAGVSAVAGPAECWSSP